MSDISASERRLSAALDRMDQLLEAGWGRRASQASDAEVEELRAANARLTAEVATLREGGADDAGLRAELESLRAERAAEQVQMSAIMAELERLLGDGTGFAAAGGAPAEEATGDVGGIPEETGPGMDDGDLQQGEAR